MGSKSGYPGSRQLDTVGMGRVLIGGRFTTATPPVIVAGSGFTVARNADGRYTVTLSTAVTEIVSVVASVAVETVATELVAIIDQDTIDTDSFEIRVSDLAGTLTQDTGSEVHFQCLVRYSSVDL